MAHLVNFIFEVVFSVADRFAFDSVHIFMEVNVICRYLIAMYYATDCAHILPIIVDEVHFFTTENMCYEKMLRDSCYRLEVSCIFNLFCITMTNQFFKSFTHDAVNSFAVMLLYSVKLESSRTSCCKADKRIGVAF